MKENRFFTTGIGVVLFVCVAAFRAPAQDEPTLKEPFLPRAPDMAAWTITYKYRGVGPSPTLAGSNAKPPDQINTVQIQKTGKIYHRIVTWTSGGQSDSWNFGIRQVTKDRTAPTYVLMPSEGPATDDFSKSDFEDLTWISKENFAGFKKGEQPVFVFQAKNAERPIMRRERFNPAISQLLQSSSTDSHVRSDPKPVVPTKPELKQLLEQIYGDTTATVVLDANTQLPIAYDDGRTIMAYQFTSAPKENLVPPPDVVKILRRFDDYVRGVTVRPSAP